MKARTRCGAFLVLASSLLSRSGLADTPPTAWDIAKDPAARERWAVHVRVQRLLEGDPLEPDDGPSERVLGAELRLEAARSILEDADAANSPDPVLRFDLGEVYEQLGSRQHRNDLHAKAVSVLAPAVEADPLHPGTTRALSALAFAYVYLNRPHDELSAWRRYIPRLTEDAVRIQPMMNMGEAEMRLGMVDDALSTFRDALKLAQALPNSSGVNEIIPLLIWDEAIALDRSGDPRNALETAARAKSWTFAVPSASGKIKQCSGWAMIRDVVSVFFVPEWERDWYLALGYAADARTAKDPRDAAQAWGKADDFFQDYVAHAVTAGGADPFLPVARARQAHAHAQRRAAENHAARLPPKGPLLADSPEDCS